MLSDLPGFNPGCVCVESNYGPIVTSVSDAFFTQESDWSHALNDYDADEE